LTFLRHLTFDIRTLVAAMMDYAGYILLAYICSAHTLADHIPQLHHIHDAVFSLTISYSAVLDLESWFASGLSIDYVAGGFDVSIRPFRPTLPWVYVSYAIYKLGWERKYMRTSDVWKYVAGLVLVGLGQDYQAAISYIIYIVHGHMNVIEPIYMYLADIV
jgi:hypothetical protein